MTNEEIAAAKLKALPATEAAIRSLAALGPQYMQEAVVTSMFALQGFAAYIMTQVPEIDDEGFAECMKEARKQANRFSASQRSKMQ